MKKVNPQAPKVQKKKNFQRSEPFCSMFGFEVSGAITLEEFDKIIARMCENMSSETVTHLIGQCSRRTLYKSLWYLEKSYFFEVTDDLPLFVRFVSQDQSAYVQEMIRERIYGLEYGSFDDPI